jgi:predicted metalloprotease with PDZ domain
MNDRPFDSYTFFYHFPRGPAGGGMEHAYSTAIDLNTATIQRSLYPFNSVTSHEFFHLWNVKRIRPKTLEPIDYTKENFTRALWFSEGVTSTAEEIIQLRAGLIDEKQFLARLGEQISELENRPAHLTQSKNRASMLGLKDSITTGVPSAASPTTTKENFSDSCSTSPFAMPVTTAPHCANFFNG